MTSTVPPPGTEDQPVLLIVDDEPAHLQILAHILKTDYQILEASSGPQALELAAEEPRPDMILLDVMMPEMDGFEVCRRLKDSEVTRAIPVVFVTAKSHVQDEERGFDLGAADYITKPYNPAVVRARVRNLLNLKFRTEMLEKLYLDRRILLDNIQTQVWYLTNETTYGMVNEAHAAFNGVSVADMAFKSMYDIFPRDVVEVCRVSNREVFSTGRPVRTEEWVPHISGEPRLISILKTPHVGPDGTVAYVVASAEDITEKKQAEKQIRLLGAITAGMSEAVVATDAGFKITYMNQKAEELYGYSFAEMQGKSPDIFNAEPLAEEIQHAIYAAVSNGRTYLGESLNRKKDGSTFICEYKVSPLLQDEAPYAYVGIQRDISDRRQAEAALRASEEKFRTMFNQSTEGIFLHDFEGRILDVNVMACVQSGYFREELLGLTVFDCHPRQNSTNLSKSEIIEIWRKWMPGQRFVIEVEHQRKDGTVYPVEISTGIVRYGDTDVMLATVKDITDRRQAEAQVRYLQKTESLGRMAGAIAHHFNNKLQGVMGNLELVLDNAFPIADPSRLIEAAMSAAREAAAVSTQMLTYLGQTPAVRSRFDLAGFCLTIQPVLQVLIPAHIQMTLRIPDSSRWIFGDPNQIQQVLTNLLANAVEAIGQAAGDITLALEMVNAYDIPTTRRFPVTWQAKASEYVCITLRDTGEGIPGEAIADIFDPFFTTHFTGRGLGLPVTLGIVKSHGGVLTVASTPGQGSIFQVWLPAVSPEVRQSRISIKSSVASTVSGVILVADDEPQIRHLFKAMLENFGYSVLEATDGLEAVSVFEKHHTTITGVICDLIMPGQGGWQTIQALRAIAPQVRVILTSGYDELQVMAEASPERPQAFLYKPFSMQGLKDALGKALKREI